jgi:hypothetical protein
MAMTPYHQYEGDTKRVVACQSEVVVAEAKVHGVGEVQGMQVCLPKRWQAFVDDGYLGGNSDWVQGDEHAVPASNK